MQAYSLEAANGLVRSKISKEAAFRHVDETLEGNVQRIAETYKPSVFYDLRTGKNSRGKNRTRYELKSPPEKSTENHTFDTYEIFLLALRHLIKDSTHARETQNLSFGQSAITDKTKQWQIEPTYTKRQATTAMQNLDEIADNNREGLETVLRYTPRPGNTGEAALDILDPFFISYLVYGNWVEECGRPL